jgi:dihydrofolate reductase
VCHPQPARRDGDENHDTPTTADAPRARRRPDWQPTTIIRGDIPAEVAKLKDQYQGEIQVHGSAALVQTLHAHSLIDEYRLFIEPVVLGTGKRLFEPGTAPTALRLVESKPMGKGTLLAIYQPTGKPTYGEFQMEEGFGLPDP